MADTTCITPIETTSPQKQPFLMIEAPKREKRSGTILNSPTMATKQTAFMTSRSRNYGANRVNTARPLSARRHRPKLNVYRQVLGANTEHDLSQIE